MNTILSQTSAGQIVIIIHSPVYDPDQVGYLPIGEAPQSMRLSEERILTLRELPAVETMATRVHVGRVEETHQGYNLLGNWIEQHHWQIAGIGREILIQLPTPGEESNAVIELQHPVSRDTAKNGA
jgi:effector-binding domain-containing protein